MTEHPMDSPAYEAAPSERGTTYPVAVLPGIALMLDLVVLLVCAVLSCDHFVVLHPETIDRYLFAGAFTIFVTLLLFHRADLYELDALMRPVRHSDMILIGISTAFLFLLSVLVGFDVDETVSGTWLAAFALSSVIAVSGARLALFLVLRRLGRAGVIVRSVAVLGTGEQARRFLERVGEVNPFFTRVNGVYGAHDGAHHGNSQNRDDPDRETADSDSAGGDLAGYRVRGGTDRLLENVRAGAIDDVVIAMPWQADQELVQTVEQLKELPVNVYLASDLAGFRLTFRPVMGSLTQLAMFEIERKPISGWSSVLKLLEDYVLASIILLLISPILILLAIAIKLDSPGPVFFMQKRLGFNNQVFEIFKFRSMYHREIPEERVQQATKGDPRVTRVGRFIRATSLDELPQLLNVLNGTMSLVGPRPHALSHNEEYGRQIRGYFARHKVRPGITGWAQVNGLRGETEALEKMEARIRHDVYYAENWSLLFDMRILVMTGLVLFFQKTAY